MNRRIVVQLPRGRRRQLERRAGRIRDAALRTRIQIVLHDARGRGAPAIAQALGCVPATAVRVAHRFLEAGEAGLEDGRRENGQAKVDPDLLEALAEAVAGSPQAYGWARPTWTRELLRQTLARTAGVEVSLTTVARMLRQVRARWGMARPIVRCPWPKARKTRRLRRILRRVAGRGPGEVAFYEDELDVHLNPRIGRDWMLPGQQKVVVTPGQNVKRYLAGALSVDGRGVVAVEAERKNSELFLALLQKLARLHPRAPRIHLILDNYVIHTSARVRRYLRQDGQRFVLHFLPPYSPDDNRIERLWREVHANVTRNHRCRDMTDLMRRLWWYLRREARRREQLPPEATILAARTRLAA